MQRPKRTISCLVQISTADAPGLRGRILVLGEETARHFGTARELVESLRHLIRMAGEQAASEQAAGEQAAGDASPFATYPEEGE